ncbi:MAG: metallophosphoesterase family protein [Candidatus Brocadiae bacterium]|nr:metallophosphoesterase family protein [Candidatus Brocadiia bacterium]
MLAVISDIHGNLEAFQAVLAHIGDADEIYCVGDLVGYGPNPNECCELVRKHGIKTVQGNHDFVCANLDRLDTADESFSSEDRALCKSIFEDKNTAAKAASQWTNSVLTEENKQFLREVPVEINAHGFTMVHGMPGPKAHMLNEYLFPGQARKELLEAVEGHLLIVGHSHVPIRTQWVVNPGSVGQPRDRNWRACFATFQDAWFKFTYLRNGDMSFRLVSQLVNIHRVPYDVGTTVKKIKEESGIPDSLGDRLVVGL